MAELDKIPDIPDHTRRLIRACRELDEHYPRRKLWRWAHMLGFRGHFSAKSRRYSTTLGALRQVRADYRANQQRQATGLPDPNDLPEATTLTLAHWTYAGHGHTPANSGSPPPSTATSKPTARSAENYGERSRWMRGLAGEFARDGDEGPQAVRAVRGDER